MDAPRSYDEPSTRDVIIDIRPLTNAANEVGIALGHGKTEVLDAIVKAALSDIEQGRPSQAGLNLLRTAITPCVHTRRSTNKIPLSQDQELCDFAVQIWNDPDGPGVKPMTDKLAYYIAEKKADTLLLVQAIALGHRDLARALFLYPNAAQEHPLSYKKLPSESSPEHLQTVSTVFSLVADIAQGAYGAIVTE
jgi:hypothetical protein